MLLSLKVQNFQKHEDLYIEFGPGLQVVRGKSEAGKSTLLRAVSYAWWGSRALPMSLEDTVTWGKPVSSLKVTLVFLHNSVEYTLTRSKSGASLKSKLGTSDGQAEVTAAVERLFGASASVAQSTLMVKQKGLEDGLDSSAMSLIEKLSNMGMIDELILKVQTQLPSGNTKVLESQIAGLVLEKPVLEEAPLLQQQLQEAESEVARLTIYQQQVAEDYNREAGLAAAAISKLTHNKKVAADVERLKRSSEACVQVLISETLADVEELRQKAEQQKADAEVLSCHKKFSEAQLNVSCWQKMPEADTVARIAQLEQQLKTLATQIAEHRTAAAVAKSSMITESACGLCGKDLSAVPEVQAKNMVLAAKVGTATLGIQSCEEAAQVCKEDSDLLKASVRQSQTLRKALANVKYIAFDESTCPPTTTWTGPDPLPVSDKTNWEAKMLAAQAAHKQHAATIRANEAAAAQKAVYEGELAKLVTLKVTEEEEAALQATAELQLLAAQVGREMEAAHITKSRALSALETARAVYETTLATWRRSQEQKATLEELLTKTKFNNNLIVRLRDARPVVAKQLWALVLSGVSHYFSRMRGSASVVTRSTDGFLIDGKSIPAFSGSTKDVLGLANRLMLQKTFIPGVSMMLLDEPGAACDAEREADLLGMLSSCGLDQIIVVTHKDIADAYAANVIQV